MPSWRDTLFFWQGSLQGAEWGGRWVGVVSAAATAGAPSAREFAESANTFDVTLEAGDGGAFCAKPGAEAEATAGKGYLLDQGDGEGHSYHLDDAHRIRFFRGGCNDSLLAGAVGRNEFGPFVSLGIVEGQKLMLARRYLDHKDARVAWSLDDVEEAGKAANAAGRLPWDCALDSRVQRKVKAPKRKIGAAEPGGSPLPKREKSTSDASKRVRHVVLMKFKDGKLHMEMFICC